MKTKKCLILAAALLLAGVFSACENRGGDNASGVNEFGKEPPGGLAVNPASVSCGKGGKQQFTAYLDGEKVVSGQVKWELSDEKGKTTLDDTGLLTVGSDETATKLTVKAVLTSDNSKYGTAVVTVTETDVGDVPLPAPISVDELTDFLNETLGKLGAGTEETPHTVTLPYLIIDNNEQSENGVWATVNEVVKAAGKFVVLDLSDCSFAGNKVVGITKIEKNNMSIINSNEYIKGIVLPDGVETIDDYAFVGCKYLTSVSIPKSVKTINKFAFDSCTSLTSITIPATNIAMNAFSYCNALTNVVIYEGVTTIGPSAFFMCNALKSVDIPASVTSIGEYAFASCTALTEVKFEGAGISKFGDNAFPQGSPNNGGNKLRTAYENGGAGTYKWNSDGDTWSK
jgi:hypothetical protein